MVLHFLKELPNILAMTSNSSGWQKHTKKLPSGHSELGMRPKYLPHFMIGICKHEECRDRYRSHTKNKAVWSRITFIHRWFWYSDCMKLNLHQNQKVIYSQACDERPTRRNQPARPLSCGSCSVKYTSDERPHLLNDRFYWHLGLPPMTGFTLL